MTQAVDQTMLLELMTAGLQPELIARVANACAAAYARGLIDGKPQRSRGAERQARYRERHAVTSSPGVTLHDAASLNAQTSRGEASLSPAPSISALSTTPLPSAVAGAPADDLPHKGGGGSNQCKDYTS